MPSPSPRRLRPLVRVGGAERRLTVLRRGIEVGRGAWRTTDGGFEAAWPLQLGRETFDLRTEVRGVVRPPAGSPAPEAALAAALLPAMHGRRSIRVPAPTSEQLVAALPRLQDALCGLFPSLHRIRVRQEAVGEPPAPADRGAGILLSLDVDSFYSLLILRKVLTHVVLVHGFDIALENETLWAHAVAAAEEVAAWTDTHVVLVRTNVRALLDRHVDWELGRGAALAHVALTLSPWLRRVTIPSTHRGEPYLPRGSHPDVDGLWSTELQEVVHHGAGVRRIDTLAYLAHEREALDHLRVCRVPGVSQFNCGRCAQCLLAMLGLEVVGGLAHAHTLPRAIPDDALRGIDAWSPAERMELEALRDAWREERPGSRTLSEIEAAIDRALADES